MTREQIEGLRDTGMQWKDIAECLHMSERTLLRHRDRLGILKDPYTVIDDQHLDAVILEILNLTPGAGETYIFGGLRGDYQYK